MNSLLLIAAAMISAATPSTESKSIYSDAEFEFMLTEVSYQIHDEIISKQDFLNLRENPEAEYKAIHVEDTHLHGTKARPQSVVTANLSLIQSKSGFLEDRSCFEQAAFPSDESALLVLTQSRSGYADTTLEIAIPYDAKPITRLFRWASPDGEISYHRIEASAKTQNFSKSVPRHGYEDVTFLPRPATKEAELSILSRNPCRSERTKRF